MDHEHFRRMHGRSGASMKKASFELALKGRRQIAQDSWAFVFERPDGFRFKAGQHVRMTLIDPPETDHAGDSRFFSLASTPQEADLVIAMRMRDTAFKRVLSRLQTGDRVLVQMLLDVPQGAFALHQDASRPAVFLVGGIGIVPAFSMIKDAIERKLSHRLFLFYSNRRPEDAAYLDELQRLAEQNPSFKLVATMTEAARSIRSWTGETERITHSMLAKHVDDPLLPVYYISGLPEMVSAMKTMLGGSGVNEASIQAETFTGFDLNIIGGVAGREWRRFVPMVATALALAALVILHAGAAVSIFRYGFEGLSGPNPTYVTFGWYAAIGIFVALALFKIRYFAGRHLSGRGNAGNALLGQGDHTKHRHDGPAGAL
ncbi:FAD-dependent oxidoreductase [Mesorhizobium sp. Mes31]|uniref:FAD-dependent oxidoreductase n=1 Tax=Mesorhizobium sp. Mes31 TaxID=2926017 RepID=UPI00211953E2|nr:FAD-dependent oxidoreductase [Mesorhizobium sp. Mes31]